VEEVSESTLCRRVLDEGGREDGREDEGLLEKLV
jgi:hypothetical protein